MRGIDVSHWEPIVKWAEVKAEGYEFAFMKASQGVVEDKSFKGFWSGARNILNRGAYHFFDPRYANVSPQSQAKFFWNLIKDDVGELPPVVDIEMFGSGPFHGAQNWYDFISTFHSLSGIWPMIYTGYYYWIDNVKIDPVADVKWFAQNCKLWIANYGAEAPLVPPPWKDWDYWQYSETGMVKGVYDQLGRLTECDLNLSKQTSEVTNMWNIVTVSDTTALRIRNGAGLNYDVIGALYRGDRVEILKPALGEWVPIARILRVNGDIEVPSNGWCSNTFLSPTADPFPPTSGNPVVDVKFTQNGIVYTGSVELKPQ